MEYTNHAEYGKVGLKNKLIEFTLEQYIQYNEHQYQIDLIKAQHEELEVLIEIGEVEDIDLAEIRGWELDAHRYRFITEQVKMMVAKEHIPLVDKMKSLEKYEIKVAGSQFPPVDDYKKGTVIVIPGGNDQQIADLEKYLREEVSPRDKLEVDKISMRIKKLRKNEFILLPVQEAIFGVKVQTDNLRKKLPKLPEAVLEARDKYLSEAEKKKVHLMLDRIEADITDKKANMTQDEIHEALKLKKLMRKWQSQTEVEIHMIADQILSHLLVPIDEAYNSVYAKARIPYIRQLKVEQVLPFLNFISAVLKS